MWLKEKEFKIRLGGQTFINVPVLIAFNGESLFTVRRHEESGEMGIDCDVYDADGDKIASIRRNNMYPGDRAKYDVARSDTQITLTDSASGQVLATIKKHGEALPLEIDVSVRTYLPDGRLLDAGPDSCTLGGLFMAGNVIDTCPVGISIDGPNITNGEEFSNQEIHLDGKMFFRCEFKSCTMVFAATAPFSLSRSHFDDKTTWRFDGAASLTVNAMTTMYHGGFKHVIDHIIKTIKTKPN